MKKLLALLLALVMAFSMVGCSKPAESEGVEGGETGIKDTIIWAQGADVTSFDPNIGKETPAIQVHGNIFNTLLTTDQDMKLAPSLAKEWEVVDETTYRFILRDDVKFHDGTPFTATDVKFSLDRAIASAHISFVVDFIESVEIVNDYEVIMKTKTAYAPALMHLTHPAVAIVSKAFVETNPDKVKTTPMGTGPYKFVEWKQGEYVKLTANEEYWGGAPKTKNLMMKIVPENAQRTIALETGEIDIAYDVLPNDIEKVKENEKLQIIETPSLTAYFVQFNMQHPPYENKLVRQAIRYALNPQLMINTILYGAGTVSGSLIPPQAFGYQNVPLYEQNIAKAKELMVEAGFPNGFKTNIYVNDNQTRVEMCQVIQSQLKEIGIEVELIVMEFGTWIEKTDAGEHDMVFVGWTTATADCDYTYYPLLHSDNFGPAGNISFYSNPKVDEYLDAGRSTIDPAKRMELYKEMETLVYEDSPLANLYYQQLNVGASKKVSGFVAKPNGYHQYQNVEVTK